MRLFTDFIKEKNRTASTRFKIIFPFIALGGLVVTAVMAFVLVFILTAWLGQPIPVFGFEQTFTQPIAFPHTKHAGTAQFVATTGETMQALGLDCTFCHRTVATQSNAGVPAVQQCIFCHQVIGADNPLVRDEPLDILRRSGGLADLMVDDQGRTVVAAVPIKTAVDWLRIHRMPDHVRFVHETHVRFLIANPGAVQNVPAGSVAAAAISANTPLTASMVCSTCHGDVAAMVKVEQVQPLKMGQCVNCHRDNGAPTDCAVCHH